MTEPDTENSTGRPSLSDPREWVEKYGNTLFGFAFKYVNDRAVAEDLIQEAFLAALKARASFTGSSSEQTWLVAILKNKIMDYFRKTSREAPLPEPEQLAETGDSDYITSGPDAGMWNPTRRPKAWSVDPNDPVEQQQFWEHLQRCLQGIDKRLARAYRMRDVQEVEYQEVCNVLAVTPTNLRVMLHRARKLLRRCLEMHWIG